MKKTEIRVTIDSVEKQQRAIEILERYGEPIWEDLTAMDFDIDKTNLTCDTQDGFNDWWIQEDFCSGYRDKTEITLDELEKLLKAEK